VLCYQANENICDSRGGVLHMQGAFISCLWGSTKRQRLGLDINRFFEPVDGNRKLIVAEQTLREAFLAFLA